jgi:DNA polymerase-3 subunit gamma/tau
MSKTSLYRKYRPQNFKNLVGQDHIRTTLQNAIKSDHVAHAYLFCGPRGTGKTSTARLLAKALNCLDIQEDSEPCDKCEMCTAISVGNLIDLIEIDAASNRGIDEIRDLKDKINFAPTRGKNKIYIIDEVHMLTKEAFNALLKTLEEPPDHVYFVLATTESHKVPETIISRCQRFDFKRITNKAITTRLMYIAQLEEIESEPEAIEAISRAAEGGLRDAIGYMEQLTADNKLGLKRVKEVLGISGQSALENLFSYIQADNTKQALNEIQNLYAEGMDLLQFAKDFLELLRTKLLEATEQGNAKETAYLLNMIDCFQQAYQKLKTAVIPQLPLEIAVIKSTKSEITVTVAEEPKQPEKETPEQKVQNDRPHKSINKNISEQERTVPKEKIPLTISYVKENWPRVLELIKTPFVRMSLKEGKPVMLENGEVTVEFISNFHKEKIDSNEIKIEIEKALGEVFEGAAKIKYRVRKVDLSPSKHEEQPQTEPKPAPASSSDITDEALSVFGGELIDD